MTTGAEIKNTLKGMGLTIVQAAKELKINRGSLNHELNKAKPSMLFIQKVTDYIKFKKMNEEAGEILFGENGIANLVFEPTTKYLNPKDELIESQRQTIATQKLLIDTLTKIIQGKDVKVKTTEARKSA